MKTYEQVRHGLEHTILPRVRDAVQRAGYTGCTYACLMLPGRTLHLKRSCVVFMDEPIFVDVTYRSIEGRVLVDRDGELATVTVVLWQCEHDPRVHEEKEFLTTGWLKPVIEA